MKDSIVTVGTRGDVQPYVALGLGLAKAGHQVKVVTDPAFAGFITSFVLEFAPMDASPLRAVQDASVGMEKNPRAVRLQPARHPPSQGLGGIHPHHRLLAHGAGSGLAAHG